MKIQIVSDLHLEFGSLVIKNQGADVLVLSGDILVAADLYDFPIDYVPQNALLPPHRFEKVQAYREFLAQVSRDFDEVIYVAGNHEFYHFEWTKTFEVLRENLKEYPNIHFLEREVFTYKGVTFLGGTLWTDMNKGDPLTLHAVTDMMNDFRVVRVAEKSYAKLRPESVAVTHRNTVGYFNTVLRNLPEDAKVVVCTHHAPSFQSVHENYRNETLMNGAYASDLSEFILDNPKIKLWTHGHMHDPSDYMIGECRIVANPRGYARTSESFNFSDNKVVEI